MKISFFGLGYVGLVTAACFANKGFETIGFDINKKKMKAINNGKPPIHEPKLEILLRKGIENGKLRLTSNFREAILQSDITFITVGTPSKQDGSIDLTHVEEAARTIGEVLKEKKNWHLVALKSTVVPGTTEKIVKPIIEQYSKKKCGPEWGLCSNPEFLREGSAVEDTFNPDRIIIGEVNKSSGDFLEKLYKEFYREKNPPMIRTTPVNAELIKYANNTFLAMKVSFINMFANLCQKILGADVEIIAKGIGLDKRISPLFLRAGAGFGGSCFPKDIKAIKAYAEDIGINLPLVDATLKINEEQPYKIVELAKNLIGNLKGRKVAILGLAFKPETDDMREAVSIKIVNRLIEEGAIVVVYDPKALENARKTFSHKVKYASSALDCIRHAECCLIVTEWEEFKKLQPEDFILHMRAPVVIDARRIYNPTEFINKVKFAAIGLG